MYERVPTRSSDSAPAQQVHGGLVISLDFELYWGVRDIFSLDEYLERLKSVHEVVPRMLDLFDRYDVAATWATVGLLMMEDISELEERLPDTLPRYGFESLCPYKYISQNTIVEKTAHFAPDLVRLITDAPKQELASHTFSHFYCLEEPQDLPAFEADLRAWIKIAREKFNTGPTSLVFPRNQYTEAHIRVAESLGFKAFRGNPDAWMYRASASDRQGMLTRATRLLDAYLPVSKNPPQWRPDSSFSISNIGSSRFLRPWSSSLRRLEGMKRKRIKNELSLAAKAGNFYHLWWHPHNFGMEMEENLAGLEELLRYFCDLRSQAPFQSLTMHEAASLQMGAQA